MTWGCLLGLWEVKIAMGKIYFWGVAERQREWVNPIPTGQGGNQPLYQRHVTKSGRNMVKGGFFQKVRCVFQLSKKNSPSHYPELEI